jgi:hypothetical protein
MGESITRGLTTMAFERRTADVAASHVEQLEEIARRLTAIHVSLATNLDGGRDLQTWARQEIEGVLGYIDGAIDRVGEPR